MSRLKETPSQTAGPYLHIGCLPKAAGIEGFSGGKDPGSEMISGPVSAPVIALTCIVFDGDGVSLNDAMIEIWQAGPEGAFGQTPHFSNWGRAVADSTTGLVSFNTLKPGGVAGQAPNVLVWIVARGINLGLMTRLYFEDLASENAKDPVLRLAETRAKTLIARQTATGYHHDIHLQGPDETVFFDV